MKKRVPEAVFKRFTLPPGELAEIDKLWLPIFRAYCQRWSFHEGYEPPSITDLCRAVYLQGCMDGVQAAEYRERKAP